MVLEPGRLSSPATKLIQDPSNELYLSAVSAWEISVAHGLGRLSFIVPVEQFVPTQRILHGINSLPLTEADAIRLVTLPMIHKDPFDCMLVCQAISGALTLLTPDANIWRYPDVHVEW